MALSIYRLVTGSTVPGSNPGKGEIVHNGPEAHPASYTISTGSFPAVKRQGHGFDYPSLSSAEVKEIVELYIYPILSLHGLF